MTTFVMVYFYTVLGIFGPLVVIICCLAVYFSILLNDYIKELDAQRRKLLDQKSRIVSDAVLSIKNIKFNAWEDIIMQKLTEIRKKDNSLLLKNFTLQGVSTTIFSTIPSIIGLIIVFSLKMIIKMDISVETIYIILLYLSNIKTRLIFLNFGLVELNSALVSIQRIRCFLGIQNKLPLKLLNRTK